MLRKRLFLIGAAALCALAYAVPASADHITRPPAAPSGTDDSFGMASCVFGGLSGHANPVVQDVSDDLTFDNDASDPANLNDTDGGDFTFTGTTTCSGADAGGASNGQAVGVAFNTSATGHFTNLICGTGHADGYASLDEAAGNGFVTLRFGILFVGGVGASFQLNNLDGNLSVAGVQQDIDNGAGNGVVDIIPAVGSCAENPPGSPQGVQSFTVNGAAAVTFSGDTLDNNTSPNG